MIFAVAAILSVSALQPAMSVVQPDASRRLGPSIVKAAADAALKRDNGKLKAICEATVDGIFVTFVSTGDNKATIAALSKTPLEHLSMQISLGPMIVSEGQKSEYEGTSDWAYIYDQNGDGRIDYISFLNGPSPVEGPAPQPDPPANKHHERGRVSIPEGSLLELFPYTFWQAIDEDGDGRLDWAAYPAEKKSNSWYRGWGLVSMHGGNCTILDRDGSYLEPCSVTRDGKDYESASRFVSRRWEDMPEQVFGWISRGAQACKLPAAAYRRLP